ncbi:MAG: MSCRAMM family protein [Planctomycetota bacterium]
MSAKRRVALVVAAFVLLLVLALWLAPELSPPPPTGGEIPVAPAPEGHGEPEDPITLDGEPGDPGRGGARPPSRLDAEPKPYRLAEATEDPAVGALRVVAEGAAPSTADATLVVERTSQRTTTTLADTQLPVPGEFTVRGIEPGPLSVTVTYGTLCRRLYLTLPAGRVTELTVVLATGAEVSGTVRHVRRGPLAGVSMRLERRDGAWYDRLETTTRDDGGYRVSGVPPGTWVVKLEGGAAGDYFRPRGEVVVEGRGPIRHDVLVGRVALKGTVVDAATGEPLPGVKIHLGGFAGVRTRTDAHGTYALSDVAPGRYVLLAHKSGFASVRKEGVVIEAEGTRTQDLELESAATLNLRVTDTQGRPIAGIITMRVESAKGGTDETQFFGFLCDGDGRAALNRLRPGTYDLVINAKNCEEKTVRAVLPAGSLTLDVTLVRSKEVEAASLGGTVRDAKTGKPVEGVRLRASRASGLAYTDAAGRYAFPSLVGTVCDLSLVKVGYGYVSLRDIALEPGAARTLDIELTPAATLHVYAEDADGRPVSGSIMMAVRPAEGHSGTRFTWGVTADAAGHAVSRSIVPGVYTLRFEKEDVGAAELEVEIEEGENTVRVRLE